jgi:hypothetical protein
MTFSPEQVGRMSNDSYGIEHQALENLRRITQDILGPVNTLADLIPRIGELRDLLEKRTLLKFAPEVNLGEGRSMLNSGMAVSPLMEAFCAREVFRSGKWYLH